MFTEEERFQIRYYLGFPDLPSLPSTDTQIEEELFLLQQSALLETRMTNASAFAQTKALEIMSKLDAAMVEMSTVSGRFPFKRVEDITFRDNETTVRYEANAIDIDHLGTIFGIKPYKNIGSDTIGLAVV